MEVFSIRTGKINASDNLVEKIISSINASGNVLRDGDVVVIGSKVVAVTEGRTVDLATVKPSQEAEKMAALFQIDPRFVEVIMKEANEILGGVYRTLLTIKDGIMIANAGADLSNTYEGSTIMWPKNPADSAKKIRREIERLANKKIGVLIIDSRTTPLRLGTTGVTIGIAGFHPIKDYRGKIDLFGKKLVLTTVNVADDLASAAHLVMGEADEATPIALIREAPVTLDSDEDPEIAKMPKEKCLYMKVLEEYMMK